MKLNLTAIGIMLLVLAQACNPFQEPATPTDETRSDPPPPIVATTLPMVVSSSTTDMPFSGSVTLQDNGRTFTLKTGETLRLELGADIYEWETTVEDTGVLQAKAGTQGLYEALARGTAILTAVGNPRCLKESPPCAMPSIMFRITVVVE